MDGWSLVISGGAAGWLDRDVYGRLGWVLTYVREQTVRECEVTCYLCNEYLNVGIVMELMNL